MARRRTAAGKPPARVSGDAARRDFLRAEEAKLQALLGHLSPESRRDFEEWRGLEEALRYVIARCRQTKAPPEVQAAAREALDRHHQGDTAGAFRLLAAVAVELDAMTQSSRHRTGQKLGKHSGTQRQQIAEQRKRQVREAVASMAAKRKGWSATKVRRAVAKQFGVSLSTVRNDLKDDEP